LILKKRPKSFAMILKMQKPFERILADYIYLTRGDATKVWGTEDATLTWEIFVENWARQFPNNVLNEEQQLMLRAMMGVPMDGATAKVDRENFKKFLDWFGPVSVKTLPFVFAFLKALMQKYKWFHGETDATNAKNRLRHGDADKTYLVRLNTTKDEKVEEPFILCYRKDKKTFEVGYKPDMKTDPDVNLKTVLVKKKIETFAIADHQRPPNFERPFNKKNVAVGGGYRTDNSNLPAIEIDG